MKTCSKCKIEKEFSEFRKDKHKKDGHVSTCKLCMKEFSSRPEVRERRSIKDKEYRSRPETKERNRIRSKEYLARPEIKEKRKDYTVNYMSNPSNKEKSLIRSKEYRSRPEVRERKSTKSKEYQSRPEIKTHRSNKAKDRFANPEDKERRKLSYRENYAKPEVKEKISSRGKEYRKRPEIKEKRRLRDKERRSKPENIEKRKKRHKERREKDPQYIIKRSLRGRIHDALRGKQKIGSAIKDTGCTVTELKTYLEFKFQDGMSWENYGINGWHIDHIIPLSSFDLTNREEFLKAVHYTNLQPLWALDNLIKGDKILDNEKNSDIIVVEPIKGAIDVNS